MYIAKDGLNILDSMWTDQKDDLILLTGDA